MSAAIGAASAEYGTYGPGTLGEVAGVSSRVKASLDTLAQQASSGLVSQTYAGLGAAVGTALSLAPQIATQQAYSTAIDAASSRMQVTQTALTQISSVASQFYANTNELNGLDANTIDNISTDARQALHQVAGLLDSTDAGSYVFAGTDSANAPVPDPDGILSSGFFTQIESAVGGLSTNGASTVIAQTLSIASTNTAGTSPFSAAQSQSAAAVQSQLPQVAVGDGQQVTVGICASANAFVTSTGTSTTGSYARDILRALATLGSLSSGQASDTGFASVVQDVRTSLAGAITALNQDAGVLGDTQTALKAQQTEIDDATTAMQGQLSNVQDADMTSTLSQLTQTQTRLQASYQVLSGAASLSLVHYLSSSTG